MSELRLGCSPMTPSPLLPKRLKVMSKADMGRESVLPGLNALSLIGALHDPTSETELASDKNVVSCMVRTVETKVEEEGVPGVRFSVRAPCSLCLGGLRSRSAESLLISSASAIVWPTIIASQAVGREIALEMLENDGIDSETNSVLASGRAAVSVSRGRASIDIIVGEGRMGD